ncbi:MaoC/PaaZ C-terminal domain-containing protein [Pseudobacillus badius]|uniref:MaoC/PaaZ C-terminal domain-containing protein n=1 Tax=Bacillus badius TaxID=1455 RepID=UPI0007B08A53|nr:MaoC/PaaZ C-terminal domain-containing protein [Bacillus badius]KZN99575.1 dehydratase [Bacillus badius]MED0665905.1 MaoC/PaaZ C-terminal domain-containing protein [Bacillus badius]OCS85679.1 dehydratase [Bacillus badius]OVE51967.1 dehydratase [Bacillus badius]TDW03403.1 acyl dehydratase [Bacillus badius]
MLVYTSLKKGQQLAPLVKPPVTKMQLAKYAEASGDFNPLHIDDDFAQRIGMGGVVAHGMLVMGFLGEYMMSLAGDQAEPFKFKMRFGKITRPGDSLICKGIVEDVYEREGQPFVSVELRAEKITGETVGLGQAVLRFL